MRRKRPRLEEVEIVPLHEGVSTVYNKSMAPRIFDLAKLGLTREQIAGALDVSFRALEQWITDRGDVQKAWNEGKWIYDHGVEIALQRKAMGYDLEWEEEVAGSDSLGRPWTRVVKKKKHFPPDTVAAMFWLKNRQPERWQDVVHGGVSLTQVNNNTLQVQMEKVLTEEEQKLMRSIAIKTLSQMNGIPGGTNT